MEKNNIQNQNTDSNSEEKKEKKSRRGLVLAIIIIIILLLGLVVSVYLVGNRTRFIGSAYNPGGSGQVNLDNSYVFASPLRASSGGEQIRITVFVLDSKGKGMAGRKVVLGQKNDNIIIASITPTTSEIGMAVYDISAKSPGLYVIEGTVDGVLLPNRVSVTFE